VNLLSIRKARFSVLCALCLALLLAVGQAWAETLDPRVARDLLEAYELIEEDDHQGALRELNRLMERRGGDMKDFDRASVLQIRGSAHVNLDNLDAALRDFSSALRLNVLPEDQQNRLRFNVAQLYFVTEQYEESLEFFADWLAQDGIEVSHGTYFMVAAANYHLERYADALDPIDRAIEKVSEPERRYYDLKNVLLSNLDRTAERTRLIEEMISIWPDDLAYWRQLAALYLEQDEQFKSFATMEAAYVNGLIESENDIILLAQYYSTFENPHRGAELIEREIENGRVERSVTHLQLLSQLWSQAREHRKAIPILREAAELSDDGSLFFRLGQALMADENNEEAEQAFASALDRGGLSDQNQAEAWLMLGNARFNQAGPGDRDQRMRADEAFERAERYQLTRAQARDWRGYISAINDTERRQAMLEQEQQERLAEAAEERALTACRARQLAGSSLSEECQRLLEADRRAREQEREQPQEQAED
jgi:tetratricopeptide (TPR) repeat protein